MLVELLFPWFQVSLCGPGGGEQDRYLGRESAEVYHQTEPSVCQAGTEREILSENNRTSPATGHMVQGRRRLTQTFYDVTVAGGGGRELRQRRCVRRMGQVFAGVLLAIPLCPLRVAGGPEPVPPYGEAGSTLDRSPVYHRDRWMETNNSRQTTSHAHIKVFGLWEEAEARAVFL